MDPILPALGGILLKALPTFILIVLLHFYLKVMFFGPLESVLKRRHELTEGARKAADETLRRAEERAAEYASAIRNARTELYHKQEEFHQQLQQEREAGVQRARQEAEAALRAAKEQMAEETARAREQLARESDTLAEQIADTLLARRVA